LQSLFFVLPYLLPKTLKNRLLASFRAACRAAEKRDYAHQSETCQTLLRRNLYFSANRQKAVPGSPHTDQNKLLTYKDFFYSEQEKGPPKKP
ncbi:MAG: hypothetical protein O9274_14295, partial [Limnobacter sp.]|uniref:hypothetical protein n=1 Tax=Limnobacter sp. TaxID=2003368 RepID=UPI0022BEF446